MDGSAERCERRAAFLRELAECGIITADGRETLNAAADLYEARAEMLRRSTARAS